MKSFRVPRIVVVALIFGLLFLFGQFCWAVFQPSDYNNWAVENGWPLSPIEVETDHPSVPYCIDTKNIDWQRWDGEQLVKQSAAGSIYTFWAENGAVIIEQRSSIASGAAIYELKAKNGQLTYVILASFVGEDDVEFVEALLFVRCGETLFIGQITLPTNEFKEFIG